MEFSNAHLARPKYWRLALELGGGRRIGRWSGAGGGGCGGRGWRRGACCAGGGGGCGRCGLGGNGFGSVNTGRAGGIINQIDIVTPGQKRKEYDVVDEVAFKGFPDEAFRPVALPAMASMLIVIRAPAGHTFAPDVRVLVDLGTSRPEIRTPASTDLGLGGLPSVLPPGTSPS